jgi:hypothetical protein
MKATTMSEHPQILATAAAYYLEQEEARLQSLHEALARLHACLVNGELAQISAVLEEFLVQARRAEKLQAEREALKRNLPVRGDGSVDWLAFESRLTADHRGVIASAAGAPATARPGNAAEFAAGSGAGLVRA